MKRPPGNDFCSDRCRVRRPACGISRRIIGRQEEAVHIYQHSHSFGKSIQPRTWVWARSRHFWIHCWSESNSRWVLNLFSYFILYNKWTLNYSQHFVQRWCHVRWCQCGYCRHNECSRCDSHYWCRYSARPGISCRQEIFLLKWFDL